MSADFAGILVSPVLHPYFTCPICTLFSWFWPRSITVFLLPDMFDRLYTFLFLSPNVASKIVFWKCFCLLGIDTSSRDVSVECNCCWHVYVEAKPVNKMDHHLSRGHRSPGTRMRWISISLRFFFPVFLYTLHLRTTIVFICWDVRHSCINKSYLFNLGNPIDCACHRSLQKKRAVNNDEKSSEALPHFSLHSIIITTHAQLWPLKTIFALVQGRLIYQSILLRTL